MVVEKTKKKFHFGPRALANMAKDEQDKKVVSSPELSEREEPKVKFKFTEKNSLSSSSSELIDSQKSQSNAMFESPQPAL